MRNEAAQRLVDRMSPDEAFQLLRSDDRVLNAARRVLAGGPSAGPTEAFDAENARMLLTRALEDA